MESKGIFQFTLETESGHTYKYEGSLEALYHHLKANEGVRVLEDKTRFA